MREVPVEVGEVRIGSRYPVRIMGVVNLSPESFYQASIVEGEASLVAKVKSMTERGADIIDIGGVSSSPQNIYKRKSVGTKQEIERVSEALESLRGITSVPVSIDTTSAEVAQVALDLGAEMVNDVSGLTRDPRMAELVSSRGVPVVIMAGCGERCASVQIVLESLKKSLKIASEAGISRDRVIVDPGIGFGKPSRVDFDILRNLRFFTYLGHPVLIGLSRKAFIGQELDQESPSSRLLGSIAATALAVFNGADMIRTHDVVETLVAVRIGEATRGSTSSRSDG